MVSVCTYIVTPLFNEPPSRAADLCSQEVLPPSSSSISSQCQLFRDLAPCRMLPRLTFISLATTSLRRNVVSADLASPIGSLAKSLSISKGEALSFGWRPIRTRQYYAKRSRNTRPLIDNTFIKDHLSMLFRVSRPI
jgi:hypothetical protein